MGRRKKKDFSGELIGIALVIGVMAATHPGFEQRLDHWLEYSVVVLTAVAITLLAIHTFKRRAASRRVRVPLANHVSPSPPFQKTPTSIQKPTNAVDRTVGASTENRNAPALGIKTDVEIPPTEWSEELLRTLEWKRFEEICAAYFSARGFKTKETSLGPDAGIDIYLYGTGGESKRPKIVVQCKAWGNRKIGVSAVRELLGAMADVGAPQGIFITTSAYTTDAQTFAADKNILLLDTASLLKLIQQLPDESKTALLNRAVEGDYMTPTCPNCGIKLTLRTAKRGNNSGNQFWGCLNYPRCRYTMQERTRL